MRGYGLKKAMFHLLAPALGMFLWAPFLSGFGFGITDLPTPVGIGGAQAHLWVYDGALYLSWLEPEKGDGRSAFRFSTYHGDQWEKPKTIFSGDRIFVNWADIPKLAVAEDLMLAVWPQKNGGDTYAYGLRYSLSSNRGTSWSEPKWLHRDRSESEHGFVALQPVAPDKIAALWLDGGKLTPGDHGPGAMELRSRLVTAAGLGPETLVDDKVCDCCGTDLILSNNQLLGLYRNRSDGEIRDIYLARKTEKGWTSGRSVADDSWRIHGCPVNGPTIDARDNLVAVAWFTAAEQNPRCFLAISDNHGLDFRSPIALGKQVVGRVDCEIVDPQRVLVTWVEQENESYFLYLGLCRLSSDQTVAPVLAAMKIQPLAADRVSGFPKLAVLGENAFLAFQDPDENRIKMLRVDLATK